MSTAFVGVGANLGDARATVLAAIERLAALPASRLTGRSRLYRSAPLDAAGPPFVNAVVRLETGLDPYRLLAEMLAIERAFGRERPYRNAPRTLDLDLLLHDQRHSADPMLRLPHPRMLDRAFVLAPLADIEPSRRIAGNATVAERLASLLANTSQSIEAIE